LLLIRGILAALRQKFHLSDCPNLVGHLTGEMKVLPRRRVRALGVRNTRPLRKQAVNSRRNAPRPCTNSAW
jgi:hypothetical protein